MKPSEKAIEAAMESYQGLYVNPGIVHVICEAAYAIDVEPLLAEKDAEIKVNNALVDDLKDMVKEKDAEIERFKPDAEWARFGRQRIVELEAEIERLKSETGWKTKRIEFLEAALLTQQDECERFHKPA